MHAAAGDPEASARSERSPGHRGCEGLIRYALHATGEGLESGAAVGAAGGEGTGGGAGPDRFVVSAPDTGTVPCLAVSPPRPEPSFDSPAPAREITPSVEAVRDGC
ncbi:hypothetical protein NPS70_21595 [Streptomyces sp. C10-9-1]|uniref:hypothetical protein n=1 Tax=Streptomyces sp. C10-9-1 TaxID=1859285 RepID=UPI0021127EAD|nr:hypothetical protein [Streptomyces sp. C10-9-1]MCQ6555770.1 hypothetical protein [Streptomyces sp. C10-9-1]